jgi:hypothetical protein
MRTAPSIQRPSADARLPATAPRQPAPALDAALSRLVGALARQAAREAFAAHPAGNALAADPPNP